MEEALAPSGRYCNAGYECTWLDDTGFEEDSCCLPDTGCSQTLISISLARQLQCTLKQDANVRLFTADGNQMSVAGLADISITNNNNCLLYTSPSPRD